MCDDSDSEGDSEGAEGDEEGAFAVDKDGGDKDGQDDGGDAIDEEAAELLLHIMSDILDCVLHLLVAKAQLML
jgi:hypothetical protein